MARQRGWKPPGPTSDYATWLLQKLLGMHELDGLIGPNTSSIALRFDKPLIPAPAGWQAGVTENSFRHVGTGATVALQGNGTWGWWRARLHNRLCIEPMTTIEDAVTAALSEPTPGWQTTHPNREGTYRTRTNLGDEGPKIYVFNNPMGKPTASREWDGFWWSEPEKP